MSFEKSFCPSPWMHLRINNDGGFSYCRWAVRKEGPAGNIKDGSPIVWFQEKMSPMRKDLLNGKEIPGCKTCYTMEQHSKVSGRQKQLLKLGISVDDFQKTMLSSSWLSVFDHSNRNHGYTDQVPQDWQVDLGNFCNSACIFCSPEFSSRIAAEYKQIGLIDQVPVTTWCDSPTALQEFVNDLNRATQIRYMHFIGGETLITPAFKTIIQHLVKTGQAQKMTIGFTTNLTTWDQSIVDLLCEFSQINLGFSIECVHELNDYIRWGSRIDQVMDLLDRWYSIGSKHGWLLQFRTTPTIFSIFHVDTVYQLAMEKSIAVESCNFLDRPEFMRPSVIPPGDLKDQILQKFNRIIGTTESNLPQVVNIRNPDTVQTQIRQDAQSYINYLTNQPDESHRLPDLVSFITRLENKRGNRVLDYLPEYEQLLRSVGYQR